MNELISLLSKRMLASH